MSFLSVRRRDWWEDQKSDFWVSGGRVAVVIPALGELGYVE